MPERNIRKQTEKISFRELQDKLQSTHTLSTKMICELLKTYRPWVSKYILPELDKLYIPNGYGEKSISWISYLNHHAGMNISESSWYSEPDFKELLKKSLSSCTRQTIKVSSSIFLDKSSRKEFLKQYVPLEEKYDAEVDAKNWEQALELQDKLSQVLKNFFGEKLLAELDGCRNTNRTATPPCPVSVDYDYHNFMAVHDLKGYGGIDETIYRNLFDEGAVKLVFNFTSAKGDRGEKIFYYYDENDEKFRLDDGSPDWTVPYTFFINNKK